MPAASLQCSGAGVESECGLPRVSGNRHGLHKLSPLLLWGSAAENEAEERTQWWEMLVMQLVVWGYLPQMMIRIHSLKLFLYNFSPSTHSLRLYRHPWNHEVYTQHHTLNIPFFHVTGHMTDHVIQVHGQPSPAAAGAALWGRCSQGQGGGSHARRSRHHWPSPTLLRPLWEGLGWSQLTLEVAKNCPSPSFGCTCKRVEPL